MSRESLTNIYGNYTLILNGVLSLKDAFRETKTIYFKYVSTSRNRFTIITNYKGLVNPK